MEVLNLKEIQYELKEMLKKVVAFFDENKIEYYIAWGTFLGSVRHQGFIPWDDDIDIVVKRKEFNKLLELAKDNRMIDENLEITYYELENSVYPFIKVVNKNIVLEDALKIDKYLWIDIFPLDNVPENLTEANKFMKKTFITEELYMVKNFKMREIPRTTRSTRATVLKYIAKTITLLISKKWLIKKHVKMSQKFNETNLTSTACSVWHSEKAIIFPKEIFEETSEYKFDDVVVKGVRDYDKYLKLAYGDYMKLPPEDKRYTHNIKACKK